MGHDGNEIMIWVRRETLSDGSHVYNVEFGTLTIPAISEKDAESLAEKLRDNIAYHTNETVVASFSY